MNMSFYHFQEKVSATNLMLFPLLFSWCFILAVILAWLYIMYIAIASITTFTCIYTHSYVKHNDTGHTINSIDNREICCCNLPQLLGLFIYQITTVDLINRKIDLLTSITTATGPTKLQINPLSTFNQHLKL